MGWFNRPKLELCYVIMSDDGRFWLEAGCWGAAEGHDLYDGRIFSSRRDAERTLAKLDKPGSVFEIGLYKGRPVILVDAYQYWMDANYGEGRATAKKNPMPPPDDDERFKPKPA